MPNRILKDSINESEGLSNCSVFAIDLYKRLINYADDYGRFNADTMIMRARLYPREYDSVTETDIIDGLSELVGVGKIQFYTPHIFNQGGKKGVYGVFPHWTDHQRVRESKSKCPEPGDTSINDWYLRRFVPIDMKAQIMERDNFKCQLCGKFVTSCRDAKRFVKLGSGLYHIDHIVPVVQGGRATYENLRVTCPECNLKRKKAFTFHEVLEETLRQDRGELPQVAACGGVSPLESESNPIQSESKSKSETESNAHARETAFDRFWSAYPKRVGKEAARKAFAKVKAPVDILIAAVDAQKRSAQWQKDNGQYIPNPATWLNQGRWEDEVAVPGKKQYTTEGSFFDD